MARNEHEAKQIVFNRRVERRFETSHGALFRLEQRFERSLIALDAFAAAKLVDGAVLRRGHEPCSGIRGNSGARPTFERCDERVLRELLRATDVADEPRQSRDESRRFDAKDRVDRAMRFADRHAPDVARPEPSPPRAFGTALAAEATHRGLMAHPSSGSGASKNDGTTSMERRTMAE